MTARVSQQATIPGIDDVLRLRGSDRGGHEGQVRRLRVVVNDSADSTRSMSRPVLMEVSRETTLSPAEIADLMAVAARETDTIAQMDLLWRDLRSSQNAKARLQNLRPSELKAALDVRRHLLVVEDAHNGGQSS